MVVLALSLLLCASPGSAPKRIDFDGKVERGESLTLTAKGLAPGQSYRFLASGRCVRIYRDGSGSRTVKRPNADAEVVGVSARIAGVDHPLAAGVNEVPFVAPSRDVVIKVFDTLIPTSHRCTFDRFAVEAR